MNETAVELTRAVAPYVMALAALAALVCFPHMTATAQQAADALFGAALLAINPAYRKPSGPQS